MDCLTDQSMYAPGAKVSATLLHMPEGCARVQVTLSHLENEVLRMELGAESEFSFTLPDADFTGYLLRAEALSEDGETIKTAFTGVDCSSTWTKFPRYGYVWDYTTVAQPKEKIALMSRYHLNGIQFYDWQYRHHQPIAEDISSWKDWSGRTIYGDTIRAYIEEAHARNMACMAYNLVYGANKTYQTDGSGVDPAWRLRKAAGADFTFNMNASLGDVGVLQFFNLLDPGWQSYIFAQEKKVFDTFDFDGWHGDTVGEYGRMQTADGGPLGYDEQGAPIRLVKDTYLRFLNAAKAALGDKYLAFNPVGAQGIGQVNVSDVDVLYTEFWPWDADADGVPYATYDSLHKAIEQASAQSGGKSLIVAAYVNYKNPKSSFNEPAVRMMDSVVFASGGARIELGNGDNMLSDEYFPSDYKKHMKRELPTHVQRLYDFAVAYENLLRDGQTPIERAVTLNGAPATADGAPDAVWCFAKADANTEIYHFINLSGTDAGWRDESQTKKAPTPLTDAAVRLYTDFPVQEAFIATPDAADLSAKSLPFAVGADEKGAYIDISMPLLTYWNMVFLR